MVLSGTLEEANRSRVEAVLRHLQNLLYDSDLTLQEVRRGSIVLEFLCSQAGFDRLMLLQTSGQLHEVMGFVVEDIRVLDSRSSDGVISDEERERQRESDVSCEIEVVLKKWNQGDLPTESTLLKLVGWLRDETP